MPFKNPLERVTAISMFTTACLGIVEILAGLASGSIAFVAAGTDAFTDTLNSIGVITGLRISRRPADKGHPYGHHKAETLALMVLAIILVLAGARIAYSAVERLYLGGITGITVELALLALLAITVLGALACLKIRTGRRFNNSLVVADGYNSLSDSISAAAVLVSIGFVRLGFPQADSIVALGISVLIFRWGLGIGRDALNVFMEASPGPEVIAKIKRECLGVQGVLGCHHCRARRAGSCILADLHVLVSPKLSIEEAHEVATRVERRLRTKVPGLNSVIVHVEPCKEVKRGKKR